MSQAPLAHRQANARLRVLNPDGTPGQPYVPEGIAYARLDADFAERIIQIEGKTEEPSLCLASVLKGENT